jgi:hypothetical protein
MNATFGRQPRKAEIDVVYSASFRGRFLFPALPATIGEFDLSH